MSDFEPPVLSVIIPTFNRPDFLRQCVASLRRCGYPNLEIIVVDDGSTEDIAAVAREFEPACKYLRQENQGPAAARNFGFKQAKGRYVAFLDSDDQWLPDTARKVIDFFEKHPEVDMVFAEARMGNPDEGYQPWIESAGEDEFFQLPCRLEAEGVRILEKTALFKRMLVRNPVFIGAVVLRREAFERAGMFDTELCGAADWELWLRMAGRMQLAFFPEPLAIYTRHAGCMSNDPAVMGEEFFMTLKKIVQKSPELDRDGRDIVDRQVRIVLFDKAYRAYNRGDLRSARKEFARLRRESGLRVKDALYWSLCFLPPVAVRILRQCKWALGV